MRHHKEQSRELLTPRVATELVFNQGLGDIFSIRLAGNVEVRKPLQVLNIPVRFWD
jgi:carbonic anhydrase